MHKYQSLIKQAVKAREAAYSPYSGFSVGAALLCQNGDVYTGCNIENASYSPTVCAERVAILKAVSEGRRDFSAIAIVGGPGTESSGENITAPCGVCRQVMAEFCDEQSFVVVCASLNGDYREFVLSELIPLTFKL